MTKNALPDSQSLLNTLQKLRAATNNEPPKARANPTQGGAPNAGGAPNGDATAQLSEGQRGAIGDHVRPCWSTDPTALDLDKMSVLLTVKTRPGGVVMAADVADADRDKLSNPRMRAFAERARRAVLNPQCATLPLPANLAAQENVFTFRFRP